LDLFKEKLKINNISARDFFKYCDKKNEGKKILFFDFEFEFRFLYYLFNFGFFFLGLINVIDLK
jgi:hypothetical protein